MQDQSLWMASLPKCGQNFSKTDVIYWTKGDLAALEAGGNTPGSEMVKEFAEQHPAFCAYGQVATILVLALQLLLNTYTKPLVRSTVSSMFLWSPEPAVDSPLAPSAPEEEAKVEQNDCKPPAVLTPEPEYSKPNTKAEPQAELPEAQSDINAVKKENEEDMKKIEDHRNMGNLQDELSERPAASPFMKLPAHHSLQNLNEKLQEEQQESLVRLEERKKRLEENIKIIEEKMNPLLQAVQKQVDDT
ncbi:hypothetical protein TURU_015694 [Turdus rufiventris]|nr:hypothetical protein TURU_015694 [Turdus rufiventris]